MKKAFLTVVLMGAALHLFAQNGVLRELSGDVQLRHAGVGSFIPASVGAVIERDTVVSTGFRSSAVIEIGSATLSVRPLTRLSLAEISAAAGNENIRVDLQAGRVRVDVRPPTGTISNFSVQGPSATASVRGTSFDFDARSASVIEGVVSFQGASGAPVTLQAGNTSTVAAGAGAGAGVPTDPMLGVFQNLAPSSPVGAGVSGETTAPSAFQSPPGNIDIEIIY